MENFVIPHPPPAGHYPPPTTHHSPPTILHHTHHSLTHKLSTLTELADGLTGEPLCFELIETARELLGELNKKVFL